MTDEEKTDQEFCGKCGATVPVGVAVGCPHEVCPMQNADPGYVGKQE